MMYDTVNDGKITRYVRKRQRETDGLSPDDLSTSFNVLTHETHTCKIGNFCCNRGCIYRSHIRDYDL